MRGERGHDKRSRDPRLGKPHDAVEDVHAACREGVHGDVGRMHVDCGYDDEGPDRMRPDEYGMCSSPPSARRKEPHKVHNNEHDEAPLVRGLIDHDRELELGRPSIH